MAEEMGTGSDGSGVRRSEGEATQGTKGHNVRYVLLGGLILVVSLFIISYAVAL